MFPLSVVIPSYNHASQLDKTLHSLTEQSQTDFHILLVDHGSTENIETVYQKYQDALHITYYRIARNEGDSPGEPRDFGSRKAESPLIVFVDCGTVLPSQYTEAHIAFHHLHPNSVGLGLQHGYDPQRESAEDGTAFLSQAAIQQAYIALKGGQSSDQRQGVNLEDLNLPWFFGWTANLSLPRAAYLASGGFDLDLKGWGFEDVDLSYRLSKQGLNFGFVEGGWGIELPQARQPMRERLESHQRNMLHSYWKQRTLALESLILTQTLLQKAVAAYRSLPTTRMENIASVVQNQMRSQFIIEAESIFRHLSTIGRQITALPTLPERVRSQLQQPDLLIGGTLQDAERYDYVTLADEGRPSTPTTWSCCGIIIPLADQTLETVVVSDLWQKLDWSIEYPFGVQSVPLLEILISEIHRTAKKAVFLHSPSVSSERDSVSVEALESMCQKYKLAFEIVSLQVVALD